MFSRLYNLLRIDYLLKPIGPLLIKSGKEGLDPTVPDMSFVRMPILIKGDDSHPADEFKETVYIPGSSMKGMMNSLAGALLRTTAIPMKNLDKSQDPDWNEKRERQKMPFGLHDALGRTFGSTQIAGRLIFSDLYPWASSMNAEEKLQSIDDIRTDERTGVAINRHTGSAASGKLYDFETVTSGRFYGQITLENYQLWQVALLFTMIDLVNGGFQKLGFGKSRGLGTIKLDPQGMEIRQKSSEGSELKGTGVLADSGYLTAQKANLINPNGDVLPIADCAFTSNTDPLGYQRYYFQEGDSISSLQKKLINWPGLQECFSADRWPKETAG